MHKKFVKCKHAVSEICEWIYIRAERNTLKSYRNTQVSKYIVYGRWRVYTYRWFVTLQLIGLLITYFLLVVQLSDDYLTPASSNSTIAT